MGVFIIIRPLETTLLHIKVFVTLISQNNDRELLSVIN